MRPHHPPSAQGGFRALECDVFGHLQRLQFFTGRLMTPFVIIILMVLVLIMFVFRFSLRKQPPPFLGFKPRCGEQGASRLAVALVPWLPTPRARWATRRRDSWAAGSPPGQPSGASLFSSTSPPLVMCQGWREDGAISLLVCVIGVVCISFLVLGLMIAVLLPGVSSTWSPKCTTLGSTSYRGKQPGVGGRRGRHWRLQGEGPMGRCLPG